MKFIEEKEFFDMIKPAGITTSEDGHSLQYENADDVFGFDFTNLTIPDKPLAPVDATGGGDRSIEYAMVSTVFKILETLSLFPLYLHTIDDEWAGEELAPLLKNGLLTHEESDALNLLIDEDRRLDVVIIEPHDLSKAVRLITPQYTLFQTSCAVTNINGSVLILFSPDDEVSFNTIDKDIYQNASSVVKSLKSPPFEIIWADSV